jgi:hypothetical protein
LATKTSRPADPTIAVSTPTHTGDHPMTTATTTDLTALREQKRQLDAQIKAAQAALPKQTPIDAVLARQAALPKWLPETLTARVRARVKAGQPTHDALDAVLAQVRAAVAALLVDEHEA